jgi:hypothetical protein
MRQHLLSVLTLCSLGRLLLSCCLLGLRRITIGLSLGLICAVAVGLGLGCLSNHLGGSNSGSRVAVGLSLWLLAVAVGLRLCSLWLCCCCLWLSGSLLWLCCLWLVLLGLISCLLLSGRGIAVLICCSLLLLQAAGGNRQSRDRSAKRSPCKAKDGASAVGLIVAVADWNEIARSAQNNIPAEKQVHRNTPQSPFL